MEKCLVLSSHWLGSVCLCNLAQIADSKDDRWILLQAAEFTRLRVSGQKERAEKLHQQTVEIAHKRFGIDSSQVEII